MRNNTTVCSTLNGLLTIKHPTLGVLVREDGMVFTKIPGGNNKNYGWTSGSINKQGYCQVCIQYKRYYVHRLVAETFLENPENKPTVDHINRTPSDNMVSNLRWATYKEQLDNTKAVDKELAKYGVRQCDNRREWCKLAMRAFRERKKEASAAKESQ